MIFINNLIEYIIIRNKIYEVKLIFLSKLSFSMQTTHIELQKDVKQQ